jgi:hypothetical protein
MEFQNEPAPETQTPAPAIDQAPVKSQAEIDAEIMAENNTKAKAKAEELTRREGAKVTPILFYHNGNLSDPIVGFLKEPSRLAKIKILDKGDQAGSYSANAEMLSLCLLKADSDMRLSSEAPQYDDIYMGALFECNNLIKVSLNQIKKN